MENLDYHDRVPTYIRKRDNQFRMARIRLLVTMRNANAPSEIIHQVDNLWDTWARS